VRMVQCVMKGVRLHGLDLSTKHVADDSHGPEMEKATHMRSLYSEIFIIRRHPIQIQQTNHG
ncbi:hypothetical protein A3V68_18820, partial [Salmonella enterica subsp. enterica serovar Louisiana]|nr:hypothetical protein [Salmonella enterica subsp. enterica serovar Louisiana]